MHVRVWIRQGAIVIEVENAGPPFTDRSVFARPQSREGAEGGRGLVIVRALSDEVTMRFPDGRCIVRAVVPDGWSCHAALHD